jgi:hypothetical protein
MAAKLSNEKISVRRTESGALTLKPDMETFMLLLINPLTIPGRGIIRPWGGMMKTLKSYTWQEKIKAGRWLQKDGDKWRVHYIRYGTEYVEGGGYFTKKEALKNEK